MFLLFKIFSLTQKQPLKLKLFVFFKLKICMKFLNIFLAHLIDQTSFCFEILHFLSKQSNDFTQKKDKNLALRLKNRHFLMIQFQRWVSLSLFKRIMTRDLFVRKLLFFIGDQPFRVQFDQVSPLCSILEIISRK